MNMKYARAQLANGGHDVDAIPEQVAGVQITAKSRPCRLPHAQQGLDVKNQHAGVHFASHLHAVLSGEVGGITPIGNSHLVPLVIQYAQEMLRPRASNPVGTLIALAPAGSPERTLTTGTARRL